METPGPSSSPGNTLIIQARLVDLMPNQEPCFQTGLRGAQEGQAGSIECGFLLRPTQALVSVLADATPDMASQ